MDFEKMNADIEKATNATQLVKLYDVLKSKTEEAKNVLSSAKADEDFEKHNRVFTVWNKLNWSLGVAEHRLRQLHQLTLLEKEAYTGNIKNHVRLAQQQILNQNACQQQQQIVNNLHNNF